MDINELLKSIPVLNLSLGALIRAAVIVAVGGIIIRILMKFIDRMLERSKALVSLRGYIRSVIRIGLWFLVILIACLLYTSFNGTVFPLKLTHTFLN